MLHAKKAFSLVETTTALIILALICSSVLVVFDRYIAAAADLTLRSQAFDVARDNMETLLAQEFVSETTEYGTSEDYPQIQWVTTVESFYEPITSRMWIKGICSAEYIDSQGQTQSIELTHWLTDLTKQQLLQIIEEKQKQLSESEDETFETLDQAAAYAGVDVETIEQWIENGMLLTAEGHFSKKMLDLFSEYQGEPSIEDIEQIVAKEKGKKDLVPPKDNKKKEDTKDDERKGDPVKPPDEERQQQEEENLCGFTRQQLKQMGFEELIQIFLNCGQNQ
ncbi:MAG: type II secretion system protein [Sedimentisphaerales bacterium]|nr:type II secretion system protein [Sedimentisphaerales bacterium]